MEIGVYRKAKTTRNTEILLHHSNNMLRRASYTAPHWAAGLKQPPGGRVELANIPTPLHLWSLPNVIILHHVSTQRSHLRHTVIDVVEVCMPPHWTFPNNIFWICGFTADEGAGWCGIMDQERWFDRDAVEREQSEEARVFAGRCIGARQRLRGDCGGDPKQPLSSHCGCSTVPWWINI